MQLFSFVDDVLASYIAIVHQVFNSSYNFTRQLRERCFIQICFKFYVPFKIISVHMRLANQKVRRKR